MKSLTIAYITSRKEPHVEWFLDSLVPQLTERVTVIIVDGCKTSTTGLDGAMMTETRSFVSPNPNIEIKHVEPKPTIWQGVHRITPEDWWAKSNALNTAIALCQTEWIAFMDDRSVLLPGWLDVIKQAMDGPYAVCGAYQKRVNMEVVNGVITNQGTLIGSDSRRDLPHPQLSKDWYGGHGALPLEWCLAVNGFSEDYCDSLGLEDAMFGHTLYYSGFEQRYDSRMKIVEDRTQGQIDGALRRSDWGESPNDASHAIVAAFQGQRTSMNSYNLRSLRESVLAGNPFPPPTASHTHWYSGEDIATKFI